jgi:hypothetical protein
MKNLSLAFLLFALGSSSFAQKNDDKNEHKKNVVVPNAVKMAFSKEYANERGIWEKEKNQYEVNFKQNGNSMSALYDVNGTKIETETDIKSSGLPASAVTYISTHYKGRKIKEVSMITKAGGEVNYEAEVNGRDLIFDKDGKFLRTTKD